MLDRVNELLVFISNMVFSPVHAQGGGWKGTEGSKLTMDELIKKVIDTAILFAGAIAVMYMIYSGIRYTMSGGDATKTKEATQGITNALIGLVVALIAYVAVDYMFNIFTGSSGKNTVQQGF